MAERPILIMSGLDGLAVLHRLLGYENRWRRVVQRRGFLDWLQEAWAGMNPAGGAIGSRLATHGRSGVNNGGPCRT